MLILQGCSILKPGESAEPESVPVAEETPATPEAPTRSFERETLYELLLAEFAGKRNRADVALGKYLKQAHETRDPQVVERAAYIARYLGAHQATLDAAMLWTEIEPENPAPRELAATELIRFGKLDEAMGQIDLLMRNNNGSVNFEFLLQATRSSDMETRSQVLNKLTEYSQTRNDEKLWFAKGSLEAMNGNHEQAIDDFDKALSITPTYSNAILARTQSMIANGEADDALKYLGKQTEEFPRNKRLGVANARYLIQYGQLPAAQKQFERLVEAFPEDGDLLLSLALLSWENKMEKDAIQYFNQLIAMDYRTEEANLYLARIAETRKQYAEAEAHYRKIGGGPNYALAQIQLALLYADTNRTDDALKSLDAAIAADPTEELKFLLAKSEVLARAERNREAVDVLNQGLTKHPEDAALLYSRAMLQEKLEQFGAMEADLRKVLQLQPNNSAALNALGYTFANRNQRLNEAWELIERAYFLNPNDPAIIDSMGWIKYRMGENSVALDFLRKAYDAFKDQEIAAHLGEVLWVTGNQQEAISVWKQSLEENPNSKVLQDVMKRFNAD
ncbi:MAG TPA: tetratricopeptide repeat protein [Dongiaceae bacterium]|nr:tetratricopeptide repeat protein [Dongiaceae bacterium]